MPKPAGFSRPSALFISPEAPVPGAGGGGLRAASVLEYLRQHYETQVFRFTLPPHSKSFAARAWRNGWRYLRGAPPLLDRFSGFENQLEPVLHNHKFSIAVIEHFWCAPYANLLRANCDRLILDLHNIESVLARTHARATRGIEAMMMARFASAYENLEREWLPTFDVILAASEEDRKRIGHANAIVYPNALPEIARPDVPESQAIVFSGNLEYHPNIEAVRWFRSAIWPRIRESDPKLIWKLVGCNEHAIQSIVAGDERIVTTGAVEDAVAALADARVCVVPLLSGSGTRFKILEAWAGARAVVSTSIGAEGLGARDGEHLLIADDADEFAASVLKLIDDAALRGRLGESGRALYRDRFTWQAAWRSLEGVL